MDHSNYYGYKEPFFRRRQFLAAIYFLSVSKINNFFISSIYSCNSGVFRFSSFNGEEIQIFFEAAEA